jgi:hypothetical protein
MILFLIIAIYTPIRVLSHPAGLASPAPVGHITAMTLAVEHKNYTGACPATVRFDGSITMDGPGNMVYNVIRSDGGHLSKGKPVHFNAAGTHSVVETWQIDKSFEGWLQLASATCVPKKRNSASPASNCIAGPEDFV